jgi:hypothetical protein
MGCLLSKKLVYKFIEHAIKNESMKGNTGTSIIPQIPLGLKAAWYKVLLIILNSSHACPGSFISAYRTSLPSSLLAYKTRQSLERLRYEFHVCLFVFWSLHPKHLSINPLIPKASHHNTIQCHLKGPNFINCIFSVNYCFFLLSMKQFFLRNR